jgi:hypothetical protein
MPENLKHYCVVRSQQKQDVGERAASKIDAQWTSGREITVRFLEGDEGLCQRVKAVAEQWVAEDMANLSFLWVEGGPAEIRIAFAQGDGSWSMLGTECGQVPDDQPTMNYGWLTPDSDDAEIQRVVLHEFGHAIGLIHEHQNPEGGIEWNEDAVIADLSQPPNSWDEVTIRHNVLDHYDPKVVNATSLDPKSIMMYPIPKAWTLDGFSATFNDDLSENDIALIREIYPQESTVS